MKTVADLKRRLTVGTVIILDSYAVRDQLASHKYLGVPRVVKVSNTVGFASTPVDRDAWPNAENSYCDWPKKAEFTPDADGEGFTIAHHQFRMHYKFA